MWNLGKKFRWKMFFQQRFLYVLHDIVNIFCVTQRTWKFCEFFFQTVKDIWKVSHSIQRYPIAFTTMKTFHSLDDPKRVCIVMETRKNFDEKNFSSKFLTQNSHFSWAFEEVSTHRAVFYLPVIDWNTIMEPFHSL